ncbi:MAG: hypothetical protein KDD11_21050 [Acidobacteria bacterium]|nr:hypothetical protein [Acidobacteriota bacterium]
MILALASLGFFLGLHFVVYRRLAAPFHLQLKVSRGIASVVLVAVGLASLVRFWPMWRHAFLDPQPATSWAVGAVLFLAGHLVADLLWLGVGVVAAGSSPRRDLVVHHLVGLVACSLSLGLGFGQALIAVALTAEAMPVATGIGAVGRITESARLEHLASNAGLLVLLLWRLPAWLLVITACVLALARHGGPVVPPRLYLLCIAAAAALVGLDVFWVQRALASRRVVAAPAGATPR